MYKLWYESKFLLDHPPNSLQTGGINAFLCEYQKHLLDIASQYCGLLNTATK